MDDCILQLGADTRILTDPDRKLPTGRETVEQSAYDFRRGRQIAAQEIDDAFTDLERDSHGRAWVHLTGTDGHTAHLWVDGAYPFIELYTGDTLRPDRRRLGLVPSP